MAIEFSEQKVRIPAGKGLRTIESSVVCQGTVVQATSAIKGFKLQYLKRNWSNTVTQVTTKITEINGSTVKFRVDCTLRRRFIADKWQGFVEVLIIAETD